MVIAAKHQTVVDTLLERLITEFRDHIHSIILFGSVARGEAGADSDIDVLVISDAPFEVKRRMHSLSSAIDLENEVFTQLVFRGAHGFEKLVRMRSWFAADITSQGLVLYDDGTYRRISQERAQSSAGVP